MPDLTDAIEELRRVTPNNNPNYAASDGLKNTILNAILSGEMMLTAHHNAMIGAMVARIAPPEDTAAWSYGEDRRSGYQDAVDDLLALTPADATTALAEAISRARGELVTAVQALGAMPEGYCFCSANRIGDDSKTHEPECADLRALLKGYDDDRV